MVKKNRNKNPGNFGRFVEKVRTKRDADAQLHKLNPFEVRSVKKKKYDVIDNRRPSVQFHKPGISRKRAIEIVRLLRTTSYRPFTVIMAVMRFFPCCSARTLCCRS
jgi:hypothetical protein